MKLKCGHCSYEWEYNGTKKFYATCPDCHYKVKIEGNKPDKKLK